MRMIRGGQGGEVRLKLYLSLLWLAPAEPYLVQRVPAHAWARLFGLSDPEGAGSKRVYNAIEWLTSHNFVYAQRGRGRTPDLIPRDERGEADYKRPWHTLPEGASPSAVAAEHRWFTIPQAFWSLGWSTVLPGTAVAVLCIILDNASGRKGEKKVPDPSSPGGAYEKLVKLPGGYYTEQQLKSRWDISHDAWSKGLAQLHAWELVRYQWKAVGGGFESNHVRRWIRLDLDTLYAGPASTVQLAAALASSADPFDVVDEEEGRGAEAETA